MKNIILSTAGHTDHGKTRLIKEITGKNTLHHKEEKLRNITIDLGYANIVLKNEINISIIDVPGHEDYLKNTICGILNSNISILVISAIEGIRRQTKEHFDIINSSSINQLIIALTKIDMADNQQIKDTLNQIDILIKNSNISDIVTCKIDYKDKSTINNLLDKIYKLSINIKDNKSVHTLFRIDNSFIIKGHGTIVSGNLISGKLSKNDNITIYPEKLSAKIKNIQSNSKNIQSDSSYTRLALNIPKLNKNDIKRGYILSTNPDYKTSKIIDVLINKNVKLKNYDFVKLYTGTSSLNAKIIKLQDKSTKKQDKLIVQLRLNKKILSFIKDDILLMEPSSDKLISSGKIINSNSKKKSKIDYVMEDNFDTDKIIFLSLINDKKLMELSAFKNTTSTNHLENIDSILKFFKYNKKIIHIVNDKEPYKSIVIDINFFNKIKEKISHIISYYTCNKPLKTGISLSELHSKINYIDKKHLEIIVKNINYDIKNNNIIIKRSPLYIKSDKRYEKILETVLNSNAPILIKDIAEDNISKEIIYDNLNKLFIKISNDYICSNDVLNNYKNIIFNHFKYNSKLKINDFKKYTNLSRKLSVLVLEYFDEQRITKRFDNYRILLYNNRL